jgi:hypothetical protein
MTYLLDANVFIQAKNLHYGLDFCPAFWKWLEIENENRRVFSIEKVGDEIQAGADDLSAWAVQRGPSFFLAPDTALIPALGSVSDWVTTQSYTPAAINTFLQGADYYLIAHAMAHRITVVTHEVAASSTHRVKIPSVCIGLSVRCITPFEMLRIERARFVLGETAGGAQPS